MNIFKSREGRTEGDLLKAAQTAGRRLVQAASQAPQKARFFREVGRAMLLADQQINGGANDAAVREAFEGHGIPLSLGVALTAEAALAGAAPTLGAKAVLPTSVKKDLLNRLGDLPGAKAAFNAIEIGKVKVGEFVHQRAVELGSLDKKLSDVVAIAPEIVLLGDSAGRAAVLGMMPRAENTVDEVHAFVRSLLRKGAIDFGDKAKSKGEGIVAADAQLPVAPVTHMVKAVRGKRVLVRLRFACGCG